MSNTTETTPEPALTPQSAMTNWIKGFESEMVQKPPEKDADVSETGPDNKTAVVEQPAAAAVPQPKPETKAPAEAPKAEKPVEPDEKWPRSAQEWKKFREVRKQREDELNARAAAAEAKLKELESKATTPPPPDMSPEVEKWKKEAESYSDRLRLLDVTQHPKFQAYFEGKTKQQIELAKRIVGTEKAEQIANLLTMPDSAFKQAQLDEHLIDLTPLQQSRLGSVMNALAEIDTERSREIESARTNHESMLKEQEAQKSKARQEFEKMFNTAVESRMKDHAAFQKREGDANHNAEIDKRVAFAKSLLFPGDDIKPTDYINAVLDAAALKPVLQQALALQKQLETLESQIAGLKAATPTVGSEPTTAEPERTKYTGDPQEATKQFIRRLAQDMAQ